jgi:putative Ca2+/H+ antiporter (TMEM165/GDT1 family)
MALLEPFIASVIFSILGEIADKTQLIILGFALKYKAPFRVFLGGLVGHGAMDGAAILIGLYFGGLFAADFIGKLVGALFIMLGIWGLWLKPYIKKGKKEEKHKKIKTASPFLVTSLTILLVEFGDKTQIASGLLAAEYRRPLIVWAGVLVGLALTIGLNVFVGSRLAEKLPRKVIRTATYVLFILFGLFTMLT